MFWDCNLWLAHFVVTVSSSLLIVLSYCYCVILLRILIVILNIDPAKRRQGHFGMLGMIVMLGTTICGAFQQLHWTPRDLKFFH